MLKNALLTLVTVGVMTVSAASGTYRISLYQDSVVDGKQLKTGDYKLELKDNNTAVLKQGKQVVEAPARTETAPSKFASTQVLYTNSNNLSEIRIGGTNTKIVFSGANGNNSGGTN